MIKVAVDWMRDNRQAEAGKAIRAQATQRTTAGYAAMAAEFLQDLDKIAPDVVLNANLGDGMNVHEDNAGNIVVTGPGGRSYRWAEAVRLEL